MFVLNSEIAIGQFSFGGVNEVRINKSLHGISDTATIKIPSIAKITEDGKLIQRGIITGKQFKEGDSVTIKLGYNGDLKTEFVGFVKQINLNMPLEVSCEGYSWLLRRNYVQDFYPTITLKDVLAKAVSNLEKNLKIRVECDVELVFCNLTVEGSGFDIINEIAKHTDGALLCFFKHPDTLWCGLAYTTYGKDGKPMLPQKVSYRIGYNVLRQNALILRSIATDPLQVKYTKKKNQGDTIVALSEAFRNFAKTHKKILNQISEAPSLKKLANEKAYRINYRGFEGHLTAFLQPYAAPGFEAYIADSHRPELNGTYLVESTQVHFGLSGARRIVEIGPKSGFAKDITI